MSTQARYDSEWLTSIVQRATKAEAERDAAVAKLERLLDEYAWEMTNVHQPRYEQLAAERALADQLAEALGEHPALRGFPEVVAALAAWEAARRHE